MKRVIFLVMVVLLFSPALLFAGGSQESNEVIIYTALEEDETAEYLELAKVALPDLDIKFVRASTGEVMAKLAAEKENPQADVVYGTAVTELARVPEYFVPYKAEGWDKIPSKFKDPNGVWTAIDMYVACFAINKERLAEIGAPVPKSWQDLLNPAFEGEVIMPNPASSGTGYLQIGSILLAGGIKDGGTAGWEFLEKLDKNIVEYTDSGSAPAKMAANGEITAGLSFGYRVAKLAADGRPIEMVYPSEGSGYELEANALVKGAPHPENAKKFLDWALSEEAMKAYSKYKIMVTREGVSSAAEIPLPSADEVKLAEMDLDWLAKNKSAVVDEWRSRFE